MPSEQYLGSLFTGVSVYTPIALPTITYDDNAPTGPNPTPQPPVVTQNANSVYIYTASGTLTNYPLRINRTFKKGTIANYPQAKINGSLVPTQADVKTKWPDGSVRQVIISLIVPSVTTARLEILFVNQTSVTTTPLTKAEMLHVDYNFEAVLQLYNASTTVVASARKMLEAGAYTYWCQGDIATTIVLEHVRDFDIGFDSDKSIHPVFEATFWKTSKKVYVRAWIENSNTEYLKDVTYGTKLYSGKEYTEVFRQDSVPHNAATTWSRSFWINTAPAENVNFDWNIPYLAETGSVPYYTGLVTESEITTLVTAYSSNQHFIYGAGGWIKEMGTTGGRQDIGHFTDWQIMYLKTGDYRLLDIIRKEAQHAGAWPLHVLEGNATKKYDEGQMTSALGKPLSVFARPKLWLFDYRGDWSTDRVDVKGTRLLYDGNSVPWGGWNKDIAHHPDPYSLLYQLTGENYYLRQLQLWASSMVVSYDTGYKGDFPSAIVKDQIRGNAWQLRTRTAALILTPDGTPEKTYFQNIHDQMIAFWEGRKGLNTPKKTSKAYIWGTTPGVPNNPNFSGYDYRHPLGFMDDQTGTGNGINSVTLFAVTAAWQHYMVVAELRFAKNQGLDTSSLLDSIKTVVTGQFKEPSTYSFYNVQGFTALQGWHPTRKIDGTWDGAFYQTWTESLTGVDPPIETTFVSVDYAHLCLHAAATIYDEVDGKFAYDWIKSKVSADIPHKYNLKVS